MNDPVQVLTDRIADFLCHFSKVLPDDVTAKLRQLSQEETAPLAKTIYETMAKNQALAAQLDRPCCQDTGVLQFWVKCGHGISPHQRPGSPSEGSHPPGHLRRPPAAQLRGDL